MSEQPSFYLNTHTTDPEACVVFYTALGLTHVAEYSNEKTKTFRLPAPNDNICVMIHARDVFKDFTRPGSEVPDARTSTEALFSIALKSKEEVDEWLARAVAAGAASDPFKLPNFGADMNMYSRAFADLDGHIWEVMTCSV